MHAVVQLTDVESVQVYCAHNYYEANIADIQLQVMWEVIKCQQRISTGSLNYTPSICQYKHFISYRLQTGYLGLEQIILVA